MYKVREFPEENYRAIFLTEKGQTMRIALDPSKPILPLRYPELLDISFGTKCFANCPFCYTSAITNGENYPNITERITKWFGSLTPNQRPFQVAIGGGGEPTQHPEFASAVKAFKDLDIMPNYTTNGMHLTDEVIQATKDYCGGVAVSCHPHLEKTWKKAVNKLVANNIRTNVHIIVGEEGSTDKFWEIYNEFNDKVEYFVLLPYQKVGRATTNQDLDVEAEWTKLFDSLVDMNMTIAYNEYMQSSKSSINKEEFIKLYGSSVKMKVTNIAFGALFYPFILKNIDKYKQFNISLYEPEIMGGYVMLEDRDEMLICKSSYDHTPKNN